MSRYNHKHKLSVREYLYRILFSLMATIILVVFMPFGDNTTHHYQKGEPWDEEAFIAQDSFPILKSADRVAREQDSLRQFYEPYFHIDIDMQEQQLAALRQDFNSPAALGIPHYFLPHLQEKLRHIYSIGILPGDASSGLGEEKPRQVRIYHGNESNVRPFTQLFSEKTAYEYLLAEEDSVRYSHSHLHGLDLMKYVRPNLTYDAGKSLQQRQEVDGRLVRTMGVVLQGQKIVDRGQIVDDEVMDILLSWEQHQKEHTLSTSETVSRIGGRVVYAAILVVLLLMYLQQFRSDYLDSIRTVLLIMSLALFFPIVTYGLVGHMWGSVYVVPYCVLPIMLRIFLDSRTAFVTHILAVLASAVVLTQPFIFIVTQTVAGLVAIYSLRELSQRYELFRAAVIVTLSAMLTYLCMEFVRGTADGNLEISRWPYIFLMMAGVLSMLAYLLLIPIERIFGFTSIVTLVELQNVNNPLLRRLSEEANGTFNHSMQVANLAADVANKIGGKAQLVRTGALYHDIGKMANPAFFTENQQGGINPHDNLTEKESAKIIIGHVTNGVKLAEEANLPVFIRDFILTHHGRGLVKYFYIKYQNEHPDEIVDKEPFTYPGPNPYTREQAILMMADACEAASHSLKEYTEENISELVNKMVDGQVAAGFFKECRITFYDIAIAKQVLIDRLKAIYHTRIQYPKLKEEK